MNNFKHKLNIIVTTIVIVVFVTSCDKQLDEMRPHNVSTEAVLFSTPEGFQRAIEGVYSLSFAAWGDNLFFTGEAPANNLRGLETSLTPQSDVFHYIHNTMDLWTPNYKLIQHANLILRNVKVGETNSVIREAKAEALFCRAFAYFNLVRCYGRPYYQNPEINPGAILVTDSDDDGIRGRNTVKETYEQVINDLQASIPTYTSNRGSSFANVFASKALLSRAYLYMGGTFSNPNKAYNDSVVKYSTEVIAGPYSLATGSNYTSYFTTQNTTVSAVEDIFDTNTMLFSSLLHGYYTPITTTYAGIYAPSPDLLSLVNAEPGDLRLKLYKTVKFTRSTFEDNLATVKFDVSGTAASSRTSKSPIRHFRLIEMYLNRAEAYVKLGRNAEALADLNVVRTRAELAALPAGSLAGQPLFDAIFNQRRIELAFEGHVAFDYFRNGLIMKRNYVSADVAGITNITEMLPTSPKVVLRIPIAEIILNKHLQQNEQ